MTNSDDESGRTGSSDSTSGESEPSQAGYEAPPIEQSPSTPTPPPGASDDTPPSGNFFPPGGFAPPSYQQQPSGYPPPYPDPGYAAQSYPPPPPYGSYPPPPSGYPGADYGYGAPAQQGTNTMAIASLVASIVGVCCGLGSIIGIVLGIVALNQIKQTRQEGQGLAIAGIAVGVVTMFISLAWTISAFS